MDDHVTGVLLVQGEEGDDKLLVNFGSDKLRSKTNKKFQPDGTPFKFSNWTRIVYAGDGLWSSEEDIYNPKKDGPDVVRGWIKAGGKFKTPEQVKIKHG